MPPSKHISSFHKVHSFFSFRIMNYIRHCARRMSSEQLIDEVVGYNHRTCPIEGDLVEVAVDVGLPKFLNHLLDNMGEELVQDHMMTAVHARKVVMVVCLLGRGLSVNEFYRGVSYLGHSSSKGAVPMTRCLLKLGAEVDAEDTSGCTPLLNCAKMTPLKFLVPTMRLLLKYGADERTRDDDKNDIEKCLVARGDGITEALLVLKSARSLRDRKNFKEVCVSFKDCSEFAIMMKKKKKKKKNSQQRKSRKYKKRKSSVSTFLELHPNILSEVFSFLDYKDTTRQWV